MPKVELSDSIIKAAVPQDKIYALNDSSTPGLQCVINPSGKKTFRLKTRNIAKKIGIFPIMKYTEAKSIAIIWHGEHLKGEKPGVKEKTSQKPTKKTVDQLIEEYLDFKKSILIDKTLYKYKWVWKKIISPILGSKDLIELNDAVINNFLFSLKDTQTHAQFSVGILKPALKHGKKLGYPIPTLDYEEWHKYKRRKRKRYLTPADLNVFWQVLEKTEANSAKKWGMGSTMCQIIKLLLLTGCRRGEILNLKWSDVHLDEGYFQLWLTKTGENRSIPLLKIHQEIFNNIPRILNSLYVFPSLNNPTNPLSSTTLFCFWDNLIKETKLNLNPDIENIVIHSLRHTYITIGRRSKVDPWVLQALVGHSTSKSITGDYIHLDLDDLKLGAEEIIKNLLNGIQNSPYGVRSETIHPSR